MGNYEYFRKIETKGNLLHGPTSGAKMATNERDCQKSIFQLTRLFKQLFSCFQ